MKRSSSVWISMRAAVMAAAMVIATTMAVTTVAPAHAATSADPPSEKRPSPDSAADPFPISVRVAPAIVLAGKTGATAAVAGAPPVATSGGLSVVGDTLVAGERTVSVSWVAEGGATAGALQVRPDARGHYAATLAAPAKSGTYRVDVVAPDGRGRATASFRVVEPIDLGSQIETTMSALDTAVAAGLEAVADQVDAQVDSPAKEQAKKKIAAAKRALAEMSAQAGSRALRGTIGAISSDAALLESKRPRLESLAAGVADAASETERVRGLTAQMSSADVGCHQLAFVTEVFKAISALLNVKRKVLDLSIGLSKDVLADGASTRAKGAGASAGLAFATGQIVKNLPELTSASALAGNAYGLFADAGAFISDTLFGMYCEQFTGPVEGIMNARFFKAPRAGDPPAMWWSYNYRITGRIVLYYPKNAKGTGPIRMNGRIEGVAHGFQTWEDALTVIFPKLMNGALQKHYAFPPIEVGAPAAAIATQGGGSLSPYTQGSAAGLAVPNSFLVGVTGVLENGSMTVLIGLARSDIDATHRVAVLILSPLTGGLGPQVTWYSLGFQKVRNFLVNAAEGESMKLAVTTEGTRRVAQGTFGGKVDKVKAKADYTLKVRACNPGC
ncbi:MAG: hypothetical protein ABI281_01715 [Caldimonas sp.]